MATVILIYSKKDKALTDDLEKYLVLHKLNVWTVDKIRPGDEIDAVIQVNYSEAQVFVFLVTPDLFIEIDVESEIQKIKTLAPQNFILPIRVTYLSIEENPFKGIQLANETPLDELKPNARKKKIDEICRYIREYTEPLPHGWRLIDYQDIAKRVQAVSGHTSEEETRILRFFDGRQPSWFDAFSEAIPVRGIVNEICISFTRTYSEKKNYAYLLLGAGGEGKSTALRQIVIRLLNNKEQNWFVIWHDKPETELPADFMDKLPRIRGRYLIASDDADMIAKDIQQCASHLYQENRTDVRFLLTSRDTDWGKAEIQNSSLQSTLELKIEMLRGINFDDALKIVGKWHKCGEKGMGKLWGLSVHDAAEKLVAESRTESYRNEGAFLGAMLRTRYGEDIKLYVQRILENLFRYRIRNTKKSMLDAFAYIAVPHAENISALHRKILAAILGISEQNLNSDVLMPLGAEALTDTHNEFIVTRHRAISEAAVDILSKPPFNRNMDDVLNDLVRMVCQLRTNGEYIPEIAVWRYTLPDNLLNSNRYNLGIRIIRSLIDEDTTDPKATQKIVKLAEIYRKGKQPDLGIEEFSKDRLHLRRHRSYYFEWALCERDCEHFDRAIWLSAMALSDQADTMPPDPTTCIKILTGLATFFTVLYDTYNNLYYAEISQFIIELGLSLNCNDKILLENKQKIPNELKNTSVKLPHAFNKLIEAIHHIWEISSMKTELPNWVIGINKLSYRGLSKSLNLER
jgi:hypothetical protein